MADASLADLLARNERHVSSLAAGHFDAVQDGQAPAVVSVCCADSRVPQGGMFDAREAGWLFTPSTIGNQVWDERDGERVVDGSVAYPLSFTGTETAVVVGHTGCGAVTAALQAARGEGGEAPPGVEKWVEALVPVVEDGLADERVREDRDASLVDQLVEYNVDRQVAFLRESDVAGDAVSVYGLVYDFQDVYGDVRGRTVLVNADGETSVAALRADVPAAYEDWVARLL